jgi:hypothetical protein
MPLRPYVPLHLPTRPVQTLPQRQRVLAAAGPESVAARTVGAR